MTNTDHCTISLSTTRVLTVMTGNSISFYEYQAIKRITLILRDMSTIDTVDWIDLIGSFTANFRTGKYEY